MTTTENVKHAETSVKIDRFSQNLGKIETLTKRLSQALAARPARDPALEGPEAEMFVKAASAWLGTMMRDPARLIEQQASYWTKTLRHYIEANQELTKGSFSAPPDPTPNDRRFANPLWESHPFFNYIKRQYQIGADTLNEASAQLEGVSPEDKSRIDFFSRQIIDLLAPTNFLATNPDALQRAIDTEGESLVQGLANLVHDIESNNGDLLVSLADQTAFSIGKNIATTEGAVVFKNHLLELIQYSARTDKVFDIPLVIFPPWINKYYILDLKKQNSMISWLVEQGFSVFVVSWANPDPSYAKIGMDEYITDGYLKVFSVIKRICNVRQVNATGYCIAGTTLALTLAHLEKVQNTSVKSATFFTTLSDFTDPGEIGVFLQGDFVDALERNVAREGVLSSIYMQRTFNYLRANDLIYQPAIRTYMMGEAPPAFDLLYWNSDSTNLPAKMAVEYLRELCQNNSFAKGDFKITGSRVALNDIKTPLFAVACESDHIAPWLASFMGISQMNAKDKTFILSQSGHIAGIINPPNKSKYGFFESTVPMEHGADMWRDQAQHHQGSWWPRWGAWLAQNSGKKRKWRKLGCAAYPALEPAPGSYVHVKAQAQLFASS